MITGSGLDRLADSVDKQHAVSYKGIPGFPKPTVGFQASQWLTGELSGIPIVMMNGRYHYYEGHSMRQVALPIRVMHRLGIQTLIITHAAGSMNPGIAPGCLAVITDHINLMGGNPLSGSYTSDDGTRFPDMSTAYSPELRDKALELAKGLNIKLHQTVFCAIPGPSLPTPAETRAYQRLGADTIGMSVVPEVLTARQLGMQVLALTAVTDRSLPEQPAPVDRREVAQNAANLIPELDKLIKNIIHYIAG